MDCLLIIEFDPYINCLRGMKTKLRNENKNVVFELEKGSVLVRNEGCFCLVQNGRWRPRQAVGHIWPTAGFCK